MNCCLKPWKEIPQCFSVWRSNVLLSSFFSCTLLFLRTSSVGVSYFELLSLLSLLFFPAVPSIKPSCAFPVCHGAEERCRLVLSYVLEVSSLSDLQWCFSSCTVPRVVFVEYGFESELRQFCLQGLKSVDSSVKKESDLPAADPSTPIPLKYEDESTSGGPECLEKQMALFLDKSKWYCCANKTFPVPCKLLPLHFD